MKVLFTGFTSRATGSDRLQYDYQSNVFCLQRALELAGHEVDVRAVDPIMEPCIAEDYDCAIVGIAACQGFSSRFKLGALWALHSFGKRAGIFPSDGKNIYVFPGSVKTCLSGNHGERSPYEYFLYGQLPKEKSNVIGVGCAEHPDMARIFQETLTRLPHTDHMPKCDWPMLVPIHAWGNVAVYGRHFGAVATGWDPTHVAIPMQFDASELGPDGRLAWAGAPSYHAYIDPPAPEVPVVWGRKQAWVVSSLQDQSGWIKKQNCKWPVVVVGNKRKARQGEGEDYVPEKQMINEYYGNHWGHLAFGYPLADGGWWRMRYVHAAMAGIVTCCDENDARKMPLSFQHSRIMIERYSEEKLRALALEQWQELMASSWHSDRAIAVVDGFVKGLVG
jgi:hypothetical protein